LRNPRGVRFGSKRLRISVKPLDWLSGDIRCRWRT